MRTHDLMTKSVYPNFHKYHASAAINIFSKVPISSGDSIVLNNVVFRLGINKTINGLRKETEEDGTYYYEFTLTKCDLLTEN